MLMVAFRTWGGVREYSGRVVLQQRHRPLASFEALTIAGVTGGGEGGQEGRGGVLVGGEEGEGGGVVGWGEGEVCCWGEEECGVGRGEVFLGGEEVLLVLVREVLRKEL